MYPKTNLVSLKMTHNSKKTSGITGSIKQLWLSCLECVTDHHRLNSQTWAVNQLLEMNANNETFLSSSFVIIARFHCKLSWECDWETLISCHGESSRIPITIGVFSVSILMMERHSLLLSLDWWLFWVEIGDESVCGSLTTSWRNSPWEYLMILNEIWPQIVE